MDCLTSNRPMSSLRGRPRLLACKGEGQKKGQHNQANPEKRTIDNPGSASARTRYGLIVSHCEISFFGRPLCAAFTHLIGNRGFKQDTRTKIFLTFLLNR